MKYLISSLADSLGTRCHRYLQEKIVDLEPNGVHNIYTEGDTEARARPVVYGLLGSESSGQYGNPGPPSPLGDHQEPKCRTCAKFERELGSVKVVLHTC